MSLVPIGELVRFNPPTPKGLLGSDEEVAVVPMASVSESGTMSVGEYRSAREVSSGLSYFSNNDVLVAKITPCYQNNKIAVARVDRPHAFGSTEFHVVRPDARRLDTRYLAHFLRQDWVRATGTLRMTGSGGQRRVPKTFLEDLEIPLPPLDEQLRIAEILDQADTVRRMRRDAIEQVEALERVVFVSIFGDPTTNSMSLPVKKLGDLISVSSGKALVGGDQRGGAYPVYGGNGINGWHNDFTVPSGTIVIGRVGAYCGAVHVVDRPSWVTDNALIVSQRDPAVRRSYLASALRHANLNQYAGRSAQPLVSGSRIYPVEIAIPPDAHQERYESALSGLQAIHAQAKEHLGHLDALFASLQHRAFRGEI